MDKDKAKRNLETILEKIHTDANIMELREYQKLYKKEISLFKRSWAAAWLFMYYDKRETPAARGAAAPEGRKTTLAERTRSVREIKNAADPLQGAKQAGALNNKFTERATSPDKPLPENFLSEEESKRLFFSIGKNRKLFPREVITLIMSRTAAAREDIGMIRILDNYSFVQVRDSKADEIIEKLTGQRFRGRTLTVNYAKPKSGEADEN